MSYYYITYGTHKGLEDYVIGSSPAAEQKARYIIEKLGQICDGFQVITLSETDRKDICFLPAKTVKCAEGGTYTVWATFGKPNRVMRKIHFFMRRWQLKSFLNKLSADDTVIAYHSLYTADIYAKAVKKRGFKLILELEEIYQDVVNCSEEKSRWEWEVINAADRYILSVQALSKKIDDGKPYIVINGTYKSEPCRDVSFDDGKIHCVYAGTFDPTKGGLAAVSAAEFLPENYHVHILGFGTEEQKKQLFAQISQVQKKAKCTLTYDGLKSGEEYIQFLQKCHIGLCTQIPDAKYTETSFPSKVLVYLANGLRVLSVRISAIEQSDVGDIIYYYDEQRPEKIAQSIMAIDIDAEYDSRTRLSALDARAAADLQHLLK